MQFTFLFILQLYKDSNDFLNEIYYNFFYNDSGFFFSLEKRKKNETTHFRKSLFCSESFDQASLHATILVGFLGILDLKKKFESFDQASLHATILVGFLV